MLVTIQIIVLVFGLAVVSLSMWGIASPERLTRMVRGIPDKRWGMSFAVVVRIILGDFFTINKALLPAHRDAGQVVTFRGTGNSRVSPSVSAIVAWRR
jgi:hypothetical protein